MKFLKVIIVLVIGFTLTTSCKKDKGENPPTGKGTFTFDGTTYTFGGAFAEDFGTGAWHDGVNTDLILYSDNIQFEGDTVLKGNGLLMYFESFTTTAMNIPEGTYAFNATDYHVFTFSENSDIFLGDAATAGGAFFDIAAGSKFTVAKNGNSFVISIDLITTDGKTLTGTYNGSIPFIP